MQRLLIVCVALIIAVCLVVALLPERHQERQPYLVASIHPLALLLKDLAPPEREVTCIVPPGMSPHVFSPKPSDAQRCTDALVLLSVADNFDVWTQQLPVQNNIQIMPLIDESHLLHAQESDSHDHGPHDPHVWMDPHVLATVVSKIASVLAEADPEFAEHYMHRAQQLKQTYEAAAVAITKQAEPIRGKAVVQFHQSMAYLLHRIGVIDAGVVNPQVGTNPSPRYLENLIKESGAKDLLAVCSEPQLPYRAAEHIAQQMNVPLCIVDPIGFHVESLSELWQKNVDALVEVNE